MKICSVEDCGRKVDAKGFCGSHYWQYKTHGVVKQKLEPRYWSKTGLCEIENCTKKHTSGGLCYKHFAQKTKYGGIKRTIHDRNEVRTVGDISYISLYDIDNKVTAEAIIDTADIELVSPHKWHVHGKYNHVRNQNTGIHNLILGCSPVDHINRNPLDNRRSNLRPATNAENSRNTSVQSAKVSSRYKGVFSCNMTKKPWRSSICGKHIGRYHSEEEAAWMYDQYAIALFGDFAKTNFIYQPHISSRSKKEHRPL